MALPGSGSLSIKDAAGPGRSIAQEVSGNLTGDKSLLSLSLAAGKTAPHGMLEFYNYSNVTTTNVNLTSAITFVSAFGTGANAYRGSGYNVNLNFSNAGTFGVGTFAVTIQRYLELYGNQSGAESRARSTRVSPAISTTSTSASWELQKNYNNIGTFGFTTSGITDGFFVGSGTIVQYNIIAEERGTNVSVNAYSEIFITSVYQVNTVVPTRVTSFFFGVGTSLV